LPRRSDLAHLRRFRTVHWQDENYLKQFAHKKRIIVRNKIDLAPRLAFRLIPSRQSWMSARSTGRGNRALKGRAQGLVWAGEIKSEMCSDINSRHQDALRRAREATVRDYRGFAQRIALELVALDLRIAVNAVGEVVGKTATGGFIGCDFSQFCIGK